LYKVVINCTRYCFEIKNRLNFEFLFSEKRINQKVYWDIGLFHPSIGPAVVYTHYTKYTYLQSSLFGDKFFKIFTRFSVQWEIYMHIFLFYLLHTSAVLFIYTVKRCRNENVSLKAAFVGPRLSITPSFFGQHIMRHPHHRSSRALFSSYFVCVKYAWGFLL